MDPMGIYIYICIPNCLTSLAFLKDVRSTLAAISRRNNFLKGAGCTMNYWTAGDGKRGLNSRAKATASATSPKMSENAEVFDFYCSIITLLLAGRREE